MSEQILGIDIGGNGMKGALVDLAAGALATDRLRIKTPRPATPSAMAAVVAELREGFEYAGPIGCTFPGVIEQNRVVRTAANLDHSWIGVDAAELFGQDDSPVTLLNDADAAGIAEMRHGAGRDQHGTVVLITIGTGLGSCVFSDGVLVPNTEFGHMEVDGVAVETRASNRAIESQGLTWAEWAPRFQQFLQALEDLIWPSLFILGGGISKQFGEWGPLLDIATPVVPAELRNRAGIVGAAIAATE